MDSALCRYLWRPCRRTRAFSSVMLSKLPAKTMFLGQCHVYTHRSGTRLALHQTSHAFWKGASCFPGGPVKRCLKRNMANTRSATKTMATAMPSQAYHGGPVEGEGGCSWQTIPFSKHKRRSAASLMSQMRQRNKAGGGSVVRWMGSLFALPMLSDRSYFFPAFLSFLCSVAM